MSPTRNNGMKRTPQISTALRSILAVMGCFVMPALQAQSLADQTEKTIVRSQADLQQAQSLMREASKKQLLAKNNGDSFEEAYSLAVQAIQLAPAPSVAAGSSRSVIVADYTRISLVYARQLIAGGRYTEAETVAKSVLQPSVNPSSREAVQLLSDLEQPEVFNKTVTPKSAERRDHVIQLLQEAQGLAESGRNALALSKYNEVLTIDPYNKAARNGMDTINNSKIKYSDEAYNETRSRLLWQVEKAWERPVVKPRHGRSSEAMGHQQETKGTDQIVAKLNSIIIPKIELNDSPMSEAVEYLKQKGRDQDPEKKGVNIFLKLAPTADGGSKSESKNTGSAAEPTINLSLNHVPLYVALEYVSKLANMKLKVDPYAVSIVPLTEPTDVLITKEYKVPPNFIPAKQLDTANGSAIPKTKPGGEDTNVVSRIGSRYNAQEYLSSQGVDFPTGASANYIPSSSKLIVRNTRDNIDQIDALVDASMESSPTQVDIQTKFLEINQNNLQELGFDWLLGPFSIGGGVYGSGGGGPGNPANYPFGNPYPGGYPMSQVGSLRSGDRAISGNSVDSLLAAQNAGSFAAGGNGDAVGAAPGIFSIAGVFSYPQFQMVIHALNQKKGIDLMAAPKVTTKSGIKATIQIVNEFIYPTQYDPPTIPQTTSNAVAGFSVPPTVTPSFPRNFVMEPLGVILDVLPTIGPDGYTIDMALNPKVTDFDGFINYGSPINEVGYTIQSGFAVPVAQTVTTNTINQPVFSVREVNTFVTVWDGQTVALGGLITENVQKVQDKVPILGDVPVAGRLFRSDVDQKLKKNLVIFVKPTILDSQGQPRRGNDEELEQVQPLGLPKNLPLPSDHSTAGQTK